jgi:ketosteroid isomerase-like protein
MTPSDHIGAMFATFDSKDASALAAFVTDDVRLSLGNPEPVEGKDRGRRAGRSCACGRRPCASRTDGSDRS